MAEAVMRKQSVESLERQPIVSFPFEEAARRIMPFEDNALQWDPTAKLGAPCLLPGFGFSADAPFVAKAPVAAPNLKDQIKKNNVSVSRERLNETLPIVTESQVSGANDIPTITVGDIPTQAAGYSDSKKTSGKRAGVRKALKASFGSISKSATQKEGLKARSSKSQIPGVNKWKLSPSSNASLVLKRRPYTDEERDEIGKNRGNVCELHRRRKQKCPPTGCPQNKLYDANVNRSSVSLALASNSTQKDSTGDFTAASDDGYGKSPGIQTTTSNPEFANFFSSVFDSTCHRKLVGNSFENCSVSTSIRQCASSQQTVEGVAGTGFDETPLYPPSINDALTDFGPISDLDIQAFVNGQSGEPSGGNLSGMQGELPDVLYGMPREPVYMDDGIQKGGMMSYNTHHGLAEEYFDMFQGTDILEAEGAQAQDLQDFYSDPLTMPPRAIMLQRDYSSHYTPSSRFPSPRSGSQNEMPRDLGLGPTGHISLRSSTKRVLSKIIDKASTWSEKRRGVHGPRAPAGLGQAESSGTPLFVGAGQPAASAPAPKAAEGSSDVLKLSMALERTGLSEREGGQ